VDLCHPAIQQLHTAGEAIADTIRSVGCEVVRIIVPFGNDRVHCGGCRRLGEPPDIQAFSDEFPIVNQILFCFAEICLKGFYPAEGRI